MKNYADLGGCYPPQHSLICIILHILQKLNSIIAKYDNIILQNILPSPKKDQPVVHSFVDVYLIGALISHNWTPFLELAVAIKLQSTGLKTAAWKADSY